ncbi:hypothetical protein BDR07DRAFT_1447953 [Suillus spraguei]|nr:hypothetical protein BDR07DRAFT_1447953 [Suillus spraguei]
MALLSTSPLPLLPSGPPAGYGWEERDMSTWWSILKAHNWIPFQASSLPKDKPRDGLLMCMNHHVAYDFFIRFFPDIRKLMLVNYSGTPSLQRFHDKAIALDISDHHAPFPSLFVIHEMCVPMPDDILWQDWILSDGVFDDVSGTFKPTKLSVQPQLQFQPMTTSTSDTLSGPGTRTLALNEDVIPDILAATHAIPSRRACVMEGTSWSSTAEDNIQKYTSSIGEQDHQT